MNQEQINSKNSSLATASLVLGILAIVFGAIGIGALLGVLAVVFGAVSFGDNRSKAIAGIITGSVGIILTILTLIFILVILPKNVDNLQLSQRDTERKNDITALTSDIAFYTSNNRGRLPDNEWVSGMTYKLDKVTSTSTSGEPTTSSALYIPGQSCDGDKSTRSFSVTILLENGAKYCQGS